MPAKASDISWDLTQHGAIGLAPYFAMYLMYAFYLEH